MLQHEKKYNTLKRSVYPTPRYHGIIVENRDDVMCDPEVNDVSTSWNCNCDKVVAHLRRIVANVMRNGQAHTQREMSIMTPAFYLG
jgi:hypothetical protein